MLTLIEDIDPGSETLLGTEAIVKNGETVESLIDD